MLLLVSHVSLEASGCFVAFMPVHLSKKDATGYEAKHKYTLPSEGDRSDDPVFLLVSLCCSLLEQPIDS